MDLRSNIMIYYIIFNKHLLIGTDAYQLLLIQLHVIWFSGSDVTNHTTTWSNFAWIAGSDVSTSSKFDWWSCNINGFNGPNLQKLHNISLSYNITSVDLCFRRHEVLLTNKLRVGIFCPKYVVCFFASAAYDQMHFRLLLIMNTNNMDSDKGAVWSGSILFVI